MYVVTDCRRIVYRALLLMGVFTGIRSKVGVFTEITSKMSVFIGVTLNRTKRYFILD